MSTAISFFIRYVYNQRNQHTILMEYLMNADKRATANNDPDKLWKQLSEPD